MRMGERAAAHGSRGFKANGRPGGHHLVKMLLHSAVLLLLLLARLVLVIVARRAHSGGGPVLSRGEAHGNAGMGHKRGCQGQEIYLFSYIEPLRRYIKGGDVLGRSLQAPTES